MEIIIGIGIFIAVVLFIEGTSAGITAIRNSDKTRVRKRLRTLSAGGAKDKEVDILKKRILSEVPWLNRVLLNITQIQKIDRLLEQANTRMSLGFFILSSIGLASVGYAAGAILRLNHTVISIGILILGIAPFLYLYSKKQKRMARFQEQLPEALDLIARALRAGHAFSGGLKMVSDEFDDPIGTEFSKTLDEINFGVGVNEALTSLARRIDCSDLQFFVVAVIIQRETGGNLAEVLEKIAHLIRERFKLYGHIRTLAAEGRLSAIILVLLPPVLGLYFLFVNPKYIGLLFIDPIGLFLVALAFSLIIAGIITMKKIIAIKV